MGHIPTSAQQLEAFVDTVRAATGAAKVDIVGHSQGGMMPRYYLKYLGGAAKVNSLVGLCAVQPRHDAPRPRPVGESHPRRAPLLDAGCPACDQQIVGSSFLSAQRGRRHGPRRHLHRHPDEKRRGRDAVHVRLPQRASVTNITVQNGCILDQVDHIAIPYDRRALGYVLNALDPARARTPPCVLVLPGIGG